MAKRILAVEPDLVDRMILEKLLSEENLIVFSTAAQAISFSKTGTFDIAIINSKLVNHNDGVVLLALIQQNHSNFLPIATVVVDHKEHNNFLRSAGFNMILRKPLSNASLQKILEMH